MMSQLLRPWRRLLLAALALPVLACGAPSSVAPTVAARATSADSASSAAAGGLRVAAANTVLVDLVRQVGGARLASVTSMVPSGVEVEDYNPSPEDLGTLAAADLVVYNGLALDRWVPQLVAAAKPGVPTLVLSDGLPVLGKGASRDEDFAANGNPHFWLDVHFAKRYAERIRDRLALLDPPGAAIYQANTAAYLQQLDQLDAELHQQVETIPSANRKLVTTHEAYPYLAAHYGFALVGVITPAPGQEPSAGELAALVEKVKAARVPTVFSEAQFSPRLAETLAREAGVQRVVTDLYNDSLGDPPADSYLGMMRTNFRKIAEALR